MSNTADYVKMLPYWDSLSDGEKDAVRANTSLRAFAKGAMINGGPEACLGMVQAVSGSIRVVVISEEGREITLFRIEKGECCVLSANCVISQISFETQMIAASDCQLLVIPSETVKMLADSNIYVRCYLYEQATERFSSTMWVLQQILFSRFDKRLAGFLISRFESSGEKTLRMTQEEIAVEVNSAREVVARMLKQFASDGLIELGRGTITLLDVKSLAQLL